MKTCKFILLFVLLVSCWNCAEPELGFEEKVLPDAELSPRKYKGHGFACARLP